MSPIEVAETEIITMKMAETEEVVKSVGNFRDFSGFLLILAFYLVYFLLILGSKCVFPVKYLLNNQQ